MEATANCADDEWLAEIARQVGLHELTVPMKNVILPYREFGYEPYHAGIVLRKIIKGPGA